MSYIKLNNWFFFIIYSIITIIITSKTIFCNLDISFKQLISIFFIFIIINNLVLALSSKICSFPKLSNFSCLNINLIPGIFIISSNIIYALFSIFGIYISIISGYRSKGNNILLILEIILLNYYFY